MNSKTQLTIPQVVLYKALIFTLFFFSLSITCNKLFAQDSLANYSLAELDTLYINTKKAKDKFPYAMAMLKKGRTQLNTQDTAFAKILFKVSSVYIVKRDLKKAKLYLEKAIDIQKIKAPKNKAYASSLRNLGAIYYYQGQLDKAESIWLRSMDITKEVLGEKHPDYAKNLNNLGIFYSGKGDYKKAESFYLQALDIKKEVLGEKHPNYATSLLNLGLVYKNLGDYTKAEPFYVQSMKIRKEVLGEKHPDYAEGLMSMGIFYKELGDYTKAESSYVQALNIQKEVLGEKHPDYSGTMINLGSTYLAMGDYAKAESFYLQAMNIQKEVLGEKHPDYAANVYNLGVLYKNMGDLSKAESFYLKAMNICKESVGQKHPDYATSLISLGVFYKDMGDLSKAESLLLQAINIQKKAIGEKHPEYALSLINLGAVYCITKDYTKAESLFLQAINIQKKAIGEKHPEYITNLINLAGLYKDMNNIAKAWDFCLLAIQNNYLSESSISGLNISSNLTATSINSLFSANYVSYDLMNKSLKQIYELLNTETNNNRQIEKQISICELALHLLERYKNELADESDKLRILSQNSEWVLLAMQILDKNKSADKALKFVEKNKSVLLLDVISNKQVYTSGLLPDSLILKEKDLHKKYSETQAVIAKNKDEYQLDSIRSVLTSINIEMKKFQKQLKKNYPKYANIRYHHSIIKANEIQASLDNKTALLEYLVGDSVVYIFYVDKDTIKIEEFFIDNKTLQRKIKSMHSTLSNYKLLVNEKDKSYISFTSNASWFYENLVAKVLANKPNIDALIIVTDGELGHLPFECFLTKIAPQSVTDYNELHYLINDYKISYNYSATLWNDNNLTSQKNNNGQILAMASNYNIVLDSTKKDYRLATEHRLRSRLKPLPAARKEVEALEKKYNGFFAFDSLANERLFKEKATDYGVIHLAMHGLLNKKEPVLSSLAFTETNDSAQNNFLCAYEITKMDLKADLVVLSACETGFGKFERGNGIASLARSFMYAGVPAMIVSLWQVNDRATSMIMQNLYNNLTIGMEKDEALRQAKLNYMKSTTNITAHPTFWSPFIMIGNTKSISISHKGEMLPWYIGGTIVLLLFLGLRIFTSKKEIV
ncbi:MAG: tetratricopeptide repeat protein [Saprospiraceae bacterium]|nr:tetratricopeptide repeat protein [Saprospiraceae bacterium]